MEDCNHTLVFRRETNLGDCGMCRKEVRLTQPPEKGRWILVETGNNVETEAKKRRGNETIY